MAKMKIQISKDDFEQSILAATSSHSEVFESVEKHFEESYLRLSRQILGEVGEESLETSEELREAVIKVVCLDAFLSVVRHLDLVLTPTGFGVVANNEVSPASSSRVEALIEQCRVALIVAQDTVMALLTDIPGWGGHPTGKAGHPDGSLEHGGLLLSHETDQHDFHGLDVQAGSHAGGRRHPAQAGVRRTDG